MLTLFRTVTQRSDERRAIPWDTLMTDFFVTLITTTMHELREPRPLPNPYPGPRDRAPAFHGSRLASKLRALTPKQCARTALVARLEGVFMSIKELLRIGLGVLAFGYAASVAGVARAAPPASLDAPSTAPAGSKLPVKWAGPGESLDAIGIVMAGAPDNASFKGSPTYNQGHNPAYVVVCGSRTSS